MQDRQPKWLLDPRTERDAFDETDPADQLLERGRVPGLHLEEQRVLAGHVMALEHVVERRDVALEAADRLRVRYGDPDEGGDVLADEPGVDHRVIAGDDAAVLELLHALGHRGRGEPDVIADLRERQPAVLL